MDRKNCRVCKEDLAFSKFGKDKNRPDGLKDMCKSCEKTYKSSKTRKVLIDITKVCKSCSRKLDSVMYVWDQKTSDHLSENCRTCKCWRHSYKPSIEEIESFEQRSKEALLAASSYVENPVTQRALFENYVIKEFDKRGLSNDWKLPIWVSKQTMLE